VVDEFVVDELIDELASDLVLRRAAAAAAKAAEAQEGEGRSGNGDGSGDGGVDCVGGGGGVGGGVGDSGGSADSSNDVSYSLTLGASAVEENEGGAMAALCAAVDAVVAGVSDELAALQGVPLVRESIDYVIRGGGGDAGKTPNERAAAAVRPAR
jgi:hypothetical protein